MTSSSSAEPNCGRALPFSGLRVVSCCIGAVGPESSRILGEFGADVIKVESPRFLETMRNAPNYPPEVDRSVPFYEVGGAFNDANRGKRGIAIDLTREEGREILRRLVCVADVVVENYRGDVMRNWGVPFERVREWNPRILYYSSQGFGLGGPNEAHSIMGPNIAPSIGLTYLWSWPDEDPPIGAVLTHPDHIGGKIGTIALLALMLNRRRRGTERAERIDLSQAEAGALLLAEHYATLGPEKREPERVGNSGRGYYAPHGVYRCRGDDRWVAIAVESDVQWQALCKVIGREDLLSDARFTDKAARTEHAAELDEIITAWTEQRTPEEAEAPLQRAGVPASALMRPPDQLADEHLRARNAFVEIDRAIIGKRMHLNEHGIKISGITPRTDVPAPLLGEHTDEICREWLGMSDEEIRALRDAGVLGVP